VNFAGKRFVFDDRGTVSLSTNPEQIRLNLTATRDDPALTATIRVTGTAARPEIVLTSTPALPQDEILSQVLFGRSASQLSAFEAAQLAAGVAALAGGGGFDVIGNLRELAGLDRLVRRQASSLTVAGGATSPMTYLEIIGGAAHGQCRSRCAAIYRQFGIRRTGRRRPVDRWRRQSRQPGVIARTDARADERLPAAAIRICQRGRADAGDMEHQLDDEDPARARLQVGVAAVSGMPSPAIADQTRTEAERHQDREDDRDHVLGLAH
jgi:translocation and assembly module TamB